MKFEIDEDKTGRMVSHIFTLVITIADESVESTTRISMLTEDELLEIRDKINSTLGDRVDLG